MITSRAWLLSYHPYQTYLNVYPCWTSGTTYHHRTCVVQMGLWEYGTSDVFVTWMPCCSSSIWLPRSDMVSWWPTISKMNKLLYVHPTRLVLMTTSSINYRVCSLTWNSVIVWITTPMSFVLPSRILVVNLSTYSSSRMLKSSSTWSSISWRQP